MQLIGIYINKEKSSKEVIKNLAEEWYPFGQYDNCHDAPDYTEILKQLKSNKEFTNRFYNINQNEEDKSPTINLNCIVGKNGSGKSTLLSLVYRVINNLACKLKEVLPSYNKDYNPEWSWGFEVELYYEVDDVICFIQVSDNKSQAYEEERRYALPVKVIVNNKDILEKENLSEEDYFARIGKFIFYSVGTNYSLYSNSSIRNEYDEIRENWLSTLYHKNDGYFTPIVLVPYRYNTSSIDTEKELQLANERVNTLALLLYFSSEKSAFVENLYPEKIVYSVKNVKEYKKEIDSKYQNLIDNIEEEYSQLDVQEKIHTQCDLWNEIEKLWRKKYKQTGKKNIYENMILYLTYKIIKMFIYYDKYKNTYQGNLLEFYNQKENDCIQLFKNFIDSIDDEKTDFTNLKIKQCLQFIKNKRAYLNKKHMISRNKYSIGIEDLNEIIKTKTNYDSIFIDLLPPYFHKIFYYKKVLEDNLNQADTHFPISSMSSGEQQILYSLSYAIYHMKNASSNQYINDRISYRNINLVFDEAELYYHPEYQRQFIGKLLDILKRSHFEKDIDSINITVVTHSPFILSDIPNSNILALKDGHVESFKIETLGSNIYDLLSKQFFMNSSIGSHVEKYINEIVQDFYIKQAGIDKTRIDVIKSKYSSSSFYEKFIDRLGDDYLHNTLSDMLDQIKNTDFKTRKIHEYERKIEKLRNEKN